MARSPQDDLPHSQRGTLGPSTDGVLRSLRGRIGPFRAGPFVCEKPLGHGGNGSVFEGVHGRSGVPVAVKVLRPTAARNRMVLGAFQDEVRALAGLSHHGIVAPFDTGLLDEQPGLPAGLPWLAMELVPGRPLDRRQAPLPWAELRAVLGAVLEALAHAHARGVIHRDIKPSNVLRDRDSGAVKLTDFGVAYAVGHGNVLDGAGRVVGTPAYMAPEQVRGPDDLCGPATDLYAVGCMAWALVTGEPPFAGERYVDVMRAHLRDTPGVLVGAEGLPAGFEEWVRRLLQKRPEDRYASAQGARRALDALAGEVEAGLPRTWSAERGRLDPGQLLVAGLGLFGVRSLPLVGREVEQQALWSALDQLGQGRSSVLALEGPPGVGKSRLARWILEQAREHDVAEVVTVPALHAGWRLHHTIMRHLRLDELGGERARVRLQELLQGLGYGAQSVALSVSLLEDAPLEEEVPLVATFLRRLAGGRPLVLHLDDAQWMGAGLDLLERLLDDGEGPVLGVLTVRAEPEPLRPEDRARCDALMRRDDARTLGLGPLSQDALAELAHGALGLGGELAAELGRRSGGHPLFATELLRGWVARDALVRGADGFELRDGVLAEAPESLARLWDERLDGFLEGRPEAEGRALEVAALAGTEVDERRWRQACRQLGVEPSRAMLSSLLAGGYALRRPEAEGRRWTFAHGLLAERLVARAEREGRLEEAHAAWAAVLSQDPTAEQARVGEHLLRAGDPVAAMPVLLQGVRDAIGNRAGSAPRVLRLAEEAADRAGLDEFAYYRERLRLYWSRTWYELGRDLDASTVAAGVLRRARRGVDDLFPRASVSTARLLGRSDDRWGAIAALEQGLEAARGLPGEDELRALIASMLSVFLKQVGRDADAVALLETTLAEVEVKAETAYNLASCLRTLAGLLKLDEPDRAWELLARAGAIQETQTTRRAWGVQLSDMASHLIARGEYAEAERLLGESVAFFRMLGHTKVVFPLLNLGNLHLTRGQPEQAIGPLQDALRVATHQGSAYVRTAALVELLRARGMAADWSAWGPALAEVGGALEDLGAMPTDVRRELERVADELEAAGQPARAEAVRVLVGGG